MAELYNEGLFRKGLVRTSGLVRPDLLLTFDDIFSPYAIDRLEAALALDFNNNIYRTGNKYTTFADAFTGTSPKLTYSTAAGSNSTMVNSSGNIVWAPHNLVTYSEDFSQWADHVGLTLDSSTTTDPLGGSTAYTYSGFSGATNNRLSQIFSLAVGVSSTLAIWLKGTAGETIELELDTNGAPENTITFTGGWQLETISNSNPTVGRVRVIYRSGNTADVISVWGAHIYRSDLGGMAPVPGAATGFEYYVPTNGSAEYLPRVGHHVYNGSAWVNEGLLIESEPRTNLLTYSDISSGWGETRADIDPNVTTEAAPDGTSNVTAITSDLTPANSHKVSKIVANPLTSTGAFTFSAFVKDNGTNAQFDVIVDPAGTVQLRRLYVLFDLQAGTAATPYTSGSPNVIDYGIQDVGGGWYRCHVTTDNPDGKRVDVAMTLSQFTFSNANPGFDGDGTSGVFVYGAQFELGSTPSSYMPTDGNQFTRTAQSLEVPPAEFGWPEPEYIGPELVVDGSGNWVGDFDVAADLDGWSQSGTTLASVSGGTATVSYNGGNATLSKVITVTAGKVYRVTGSISNVVSTGPRFKLGSSAGATDYLNAQAAGDYDEIIVATSSVLSIYVQCIGAGSLDLDNISVREINPLSVSIQMDGRMTYADEGASTQAMFYRWYVSGSDRIQARFYTNTGTGGLNVSQTATSGGSASSAINNVYTPGVYVPFNIASRHGSTFVNGAVDGVALTANTTLTALPDLSSTNLQIAYDFMGTIGTFRQFAGDIGDTGLVTATEPSTEPTLSLTFDGTGGSFYNLSWSE